jgi:hypothetical protein
MLQPLAVVTPIVTEVSPRSILSNPTRTLIVRRQLDTAQPHQLWFLTSPSLNHRQTN